MTPSISAALVNEVEERVADRSRIDGPGTFVAHDAGGVYLIDGTRHQLRFLPDSDVAAISVFPKPTPVKGSVIKTTKCRTAFKIEQSD